MDELTLDDKKYLSSKKAAQVTGYAKDYVGQLCREGRVTARLVGRNWYVLESAILEHRFGAEEVSPEAKNAPTAAVSTPERVWETPRYVSEPIATMPEFTPKPIQTAPERPTATESSNVLVDMQSAWKEWFETQEQHEEKLAEASVAAPAEASEPELIAEEPKEEQIPVHIARTTTESAEPEITLNEPVVIERIRPVQRVPLHYADTTQNQPQREQKRTSKRPQRLKIRKYGAKSGNAFRTKAILLSITGIAIALAVIGSGTADNFIPKKGYGTFITNYISGTQVISK